jgi:CheY-like chemotaxis protein
MVWSKTPLYPAAIAISRFCRQFMPTSPNSAWQSGTGGTDAGLDAMPDIDKSEIAPCKSCADDIPDEEKALNMRQPDTLRRLSPFSLSSKRCILIVDDNESVRETLADILEFAGFDPVQAGDAIEALTILRRQSSIDVLVTDLTMPGADGITLIRKAREIRCNLPAILLTGYAEHVTSTTATAEANFLVLCKPIESKRLIEQLDLLLARSTND